MTENTKKTEGEKQASKQAGRKPVASAHNNADAQQKQKLLKELVSRGREDPEFYNSQNRLMMPPAKAGMVNRWISIEDLSQLEGTFKDRIRNGWCPIDPKDVAPEHYNAQIHYYESIGQDVILAQYEGSMMVLCENAEKTVRDRDEYWQNRDEALRQELVYGDLPSDVTKTDVNSSEYYAGRRVEGGGKQLNVG